MALFQSGPATRDLRGFLQLLEERGQLRRITAPVDPDLELAAIADRVLSQGGPALLFENVIGSSMPVAVNTLGTVERVVWNVAGRLSSSKPGSRRPANNRGHQGLQEGKQFARVFWDLVKAKPDRDLNPPCRQQVFEVIKSTSMTSLIQPDGGRRWRDHPRSGDHQDPETGVPNVGVYRLQKQSVNTMTVHWLSVRGGARHLRKAAALGKKLEVAVAIGVHPLLVMAAATPIPVQLSEWLFAGIYAGEGVRLAPCKTIDLQVPSHSEVVLEGTITPGEVMPDGPFGDHMGFYGGVEDSPLVRFHCMTQRRNPCFSPPSADVHQRRSDAGHRLEPDLHADPSPAIPEITDFFLPMEALSYKLAVISIDKAYPGQAKRRRWPSGMPCPVHLHQVRGGGRSPHQRSRSPPGGVGDRCLVDPQRDLFTLENTPFDSLDFASEQLGLGGRLAIDATTKVGPEKNHEWGEPLSRPAELEAHVSKRWDELGLSDLGDQEPDPSLFGYALDRLIQGLKIGQ